MGSATLGSAPALLALLTASGFRLAGHRFHKPFLVFLAGTAGLVAGWGLLQGVALRPGNLPFLAVMGAFVAALLAPAPRPPRGRARPVSPLPRLIGVVILTLFGAWWLAGGTRAFALGQAAPWLLAATALIASACVGAADLWAVLAAALSLWAALLAVGWPLASAGFALVSAAACAGAGPVLPLAFGLGVADAIALLQFRALPHARPAAAILAVLAPLLCLGLIRLWRGRFARFGRHAAAVRAALAAACACLLAFSAAAMAGLR